MTVPVPEEPEEPDYPLSGKTPDVDYGKARINWVAVAVIVVIVLGLALVSVVAAVCAALVIALILTVNNSGTGRWTPGSIGDDTRAARAPRRKGPRDY